MLTPPLICRSIVTIMKKLQLVAVVAALSAASSAHAQDHTRFAVTLGYGWDQVAGTTFATDVPVVCQGIECGEVEADKDTDGMTFSASWYVTPSIAIELWGAQGGEVGTEIDYELSPDTTLTRYRAKPMALSGQYHFMAGERFVPFVGLGWQRTKISDVSVNPDDIGVQGLEMDNVDGVIALAGVDYNINDRWFVRGDVRYLDGKSRTKTIDNTRDVDMSTTTVGLSAGLRF